MLSVKRNVRGRGVRRSSIWFVSAQKLAKKGLRNITPLPRTRPVFTNAFPSIWPCNAQTVHLAPGSLAILGFVPRNALASGI